MSRIFSKLLKIAPSKTKALDKPYDYYASIKEKTKMLYYKHNLSRYTHAPNKQFYKIPMNDEIAIEIFYNFNLNLCNQAIYNYEQNFNENDLYFMAEFRIEKILDDIIKTFTRDIIKMKEIEKRKLSY